MTDSPMGTKPPTSPCSRRKINTCHGEVDTAQRNAVSVTAARTMDMTSFGPRRSAWIDQKGAERAIINGVTPEMSPAQKAASPASVTPSSPRKRGRNAMTPIIAIPAPTWMAHIRYTIRFQPVFLSIAPPSLLSF